MKHNSDFTIPGPDEMQVRLRMWKKIQKTRFYSLENKSEYELHLALRQQEILRNPVVTKDQP